MGRNPYQPTVPKPPSQKAQKIPTFASAVSVQTLWRSDQQLHQILLLLRTRLLESAHENTADGYCCRRTLIHLVVVIVKVGIQNKSKMIHLTQAPPPRCCSIECRQCDIAIGKGK